MFWLDVMVWVVMILAHVGAMIVRNREATTDRARPSPPVEPDNWRCPDAAEFARIFGGPGFRINEPRAGEPDNWRCPDAAEFARIFGGPGSRTNDRRAGDFPILSSARSHPLWDRDLDS
jgi:hypothetical protein